MPQLLIKELCAGHELRFIYTILRIKVSNSSEDTNEIPIDKTYIDRPCGPKTVAGTKMIWYDH